MNENVNAEVVVLANLFKGDAAGGRVEAKANERRAKNKATFKSNSLLLSSTNCVNRCMCERE